MTYTEGFLDCHGSGYHDPLTWGLTPLKRLATFLSSLAMLSSPRVRPGVEASVMNDDAAVSSIRYYIGGALNMFAMSAASKRLKKFSMSQSTF